MSISHELDTKIMAEEIYILVGIKLWAKAVDVDNRRTDYDGRIVPIVVEIVRQLHARADGDLLAIRW